MFGARHASSYYILASLSKPDKSMKLETHGVRPLVTIYTLGVLPNQSQTNQKDSLI